MTRILAALALACVLSACQTPDSARWGQIAVATGAVIGETRADPAVARASARLAEYCGALQAVAFGATLFAPEKHRQAATIASAAVNTICAAPPADVASALVTAARTYEAVQAARNGI